MARGSKQAEKTRLTRLSYRFLIDHEEKGTAFTVEELAAATGWKPGTIKTYLVRNWGQLVHRAANGGYRVAGLSAYSEAEYERMMSQRSEVSADPRRPELPSDVESLVRKARESALLGLHIYNSPSTVFRTEGFAVLMVIAWTALLHAIFANRSEDYFYCEPDGITHKLVDGDRKAWELTTCVAKYWKGTAHAVASNLDFFIKLRNRVEHRYVPSIDPHVAGECQALLLNFDEVMEQNFGSYYVIRESLAVPLQTTTLRAASQTHALRKLQAKHFDEMKDFVDAFRKDLPDELYQDPKFSFRVYLVPKTGSHVGSSDLAVEFVKVDASNAEEMKAVHKQIVAIKEKHVSVQNADLLKPTAVQEQVAAAIGRTFASTQHVRARRYFKIRKPGSFDPEGCDSRYCVPDLMHKDFGYTAEWVALLIKELSDESAYNKIVGNKAPPKLA